MNLLASAPNPQEYPQAIFEHFPPQHSLVPPATDNVAPARQALG